jgi:hypothetical protein
MDAWLLIKPERKKTRKFIVNWLNKIEKPFPTQSYNPKPIPNPEIIPKDFKPDPKGQERIQEIISSISKEKDKPIRKGLIATVISTEEGGEE